MNARMPNPMQRTATWFGERTGCLTASRMACALAFKKDGTEAKERADYKREILAERLTGQVVPHYVTAAMQWGTDQEPAAKMAYEGVTGNLVLDAPFVPHPRIEFCGASPDGFVDDGLIEVKAPTTSKHIAWMLAGVVPEEYKPQMLLQMACTGRRWCDFVSFDPRLPLAQRVFIRQFTPDESEIERVEEAARLFLAEVEAMFQQITEASA